MSGQNNSGRFNAMLQSKLRKSPDSIVEIESLLRSSSRCGMFRQSWSVYRQLTASLRPKTLSCMTAGSQAAEQALSTSKYRLEQLKALSDVEEEVRQFVDSETFRQRLARTFAVDPYIGYTPQRKDVEFLTQIAMYSFIVFGIINGFAEGRQKFKDAHKVTMFGSKMSVYKMKTNLMVKHGIACGARVWFKCSLAFISGFGLQQLIEIYLNKSTFWSFGVGFGAVGAMSRIKVGPKSMGATFVIGFFIGSIVGSVILGAKKYDGKTQEEMNFKAAKIYYTERRPFVQLSRQNVSTSDDVEEAE